MVEKEAVGSARSEDAAGGERGSTLSGRGFWQGPRPVCWEVHTGLRPRPHTRAGPGLPRPRGPETVSLVSRLRRGSGCRASGLGRTRIFLCSRTHPSSGFLLETRPPSVLVGCRFSLRGPL